MRVNVIVSEENLLAARRVHRAYKKCENMEDKVLRNDEKSAYSQIVVHTGDTEAMAMRTRRRLFCSHQHVDSNIGYSA